MKKKLRMLILVLVVFMGLETPLAVAAAQIPYEGYTYDSEGFGQYSPNTYLPEKSFSGKDAGIAFADIQDMQIYNNQMYILDSGASCIWITDLSLTEGTGIPLSVTLTNAKGLFVNENSIYVADTGALCVYRFDHNGTLTQKYTQPESAIYDTTVSFAPQRVIVDRAGNVYALVDGLYVGALMFSDRGEFLGYFGANKMEMDWEMLLDQFWKKLLNREQRDAMERFVPMAYTSFDIDGEDFIYTCSQNANDSSMSVRKINPSGKGLWDDRNLIFGEEFGSMTAIEGLDNMSRFIDLDISECGVLSVLDMSRGRVFQYDENGTPLGIFGGRGQQLGTFQHPTAIESVDDKVYVLDTAAQSITMFTQTEYGKVLFEAVSIYNEGAYIEAEPLWDAVLQKNPSLELAYVGKGKALFARGESKEALNILKHSGDREQYSQVFSQYRILWVRDNFYVLFLMLLVVIALFQGRKIWRKKHPRTKKSVLKYHFRVMLHPADALQDLAEQKRYSVWFSGGIVVTWLLLDIVEFFGTGYSFNHNIPAHFNLFISVISTVVIYILWVVVNWAVSTLNDGKGTMKRIWCASAYVLLPYLLSKILCLGLSQVLTLDEGAFIVWIETAGFLWSVLLLLFMVTEIHHYTLGKAVGNIFTTLFGCICVMFLLLLMAALYDQTANIVKIIYNELALRR